MKENRPAILVVEERRLRFELVKELYQQCMGDEGDFVLSDNAQILKLDRAASMIIEPFSVNYNSKKILTKLYQEIALCGNEEFFEEKEKINRDILCLFNKIMLKIPYNITTKLDLDLVGICKIYDVVMESAGETLLERLIGYMRVMNQLCSVKVFIFLNLRMYLLKEEVKALYEFAGYQKVYLLLIEYAMPKELLGEKGCIIDEDCCIIEFG